MRASESTCPSMQTHTHKKPHRKQTHTKKKGSFLSTIHLLLFLGGLHFRICVSPTPVFFLFLSFYAKSLHMYTHMPHATCTEHIFHVQEPVCVHLSMKMCISLHVKWEKIKRKSGGNLFLFPACAACGQKGLTLRRLLHIRDRRESKERSAGISLFFLSFG